MNEKPDPYGRDAKRPYQIPLKGWCKLDNECGARASEMDALGYYHERKDEQRDVGLGPENDWSSHCADAFGLMAIAYEEPSRLTSWNRKLE